MYLFTNIQMVALLKGIMCRLELFSINQWHFKIAYTVVFLRLDSRTYLWKRWKTMFLQWLRKTRTKGFYVDRADTTTTTTRGEMFCIVFNLMLCIRVCVCVWLVLDKWLFWNVMKQLHLLLVFIQNYLHMNVTRIFAQCTWMILFRIIKTAQKNSEQNRIEFFCKQNGIIFQL